MTPCPTRRTSPLGFPACTLGFGLVLGFVLGFVPGTAAADQADTAAGEALFEAQKCNTCHAVAAAEIEAKVKSPKMLGPDLSGYEVEDAEALAAYLRRETKIDGEAHKREFKGTDEELQAICRWLESLEPLDGDQTSDDGTD